MLIIYWLHKVKETALISTGSEFVELKAQVPESQPVNEDFGLNVAAEQSFATQLTITYANAIISINENTPKELLAMVCEVINHA